MPIKPATQSSVTVCWGSLLFCIAFSFSVITQAKTEHLADHCIKAKNIVRAPLHKDTTMPIRMDHFCISKNALSQEEIKKIKTWGVKNGYTFHQMHFSTHSVSRNDAIVLANAASERAGFTPVYTYRVFSLVRNILAPFKNSTTQNGRDVVIRNAHHIQGEKTTIVERVANGYRIPSSTEIQLAFRYKGRSSTYALPFDIVTPSGDRFWSITKKHYIRHKEAPYYSSRNPLNPIIQYFAFPDFNMKYFDMCLPHVPCLNSLPLFSTHIGAFSDKGYTLTRSISRHLFMKNIGHVEVSRGEAILQYTRGTSQHYVRFSREYDSAS
jgi:hypothetical protein